MRPDRRAVIFDLDDTLYPYRRFVLSGFASVAERLERSHRLPASRTFRLLTCAMRGPQRGRELQACMEALALPADMLPELVSAMRDHRPRLRLPMAARRTLVSLRQRGWQTGLLTNGSMPIQARKVSSLGLTPYVDAVLYAPEHGSGTGKPDPQPFKEIARRLDVAPGRSVFVGDDERCDVGGASAAGMIPIRCLAWVSPFGSTVARAVAYDLADIPALAHALVQEGRHAA